ncbi:MAG: ATP-binding cassette domain-containing protein [Silicimonas sp.]|nr:ATP-binding cassette domain-containing protein [Silicimonas sp.]
MLNLDDIGFARNGFRLTADFQVPGPGITAVIGPSGGGKSTLLSLIAGFETPDAGRILVNNQDITADPPGDRPVAILFQDNNLFPHLDVLANVALGESPRVRPTPATLARSKDALSRVGLEGAEHRHPRDLSGGQQSRAALARILLTDRPVVLMDEAFSALGPALRTDMLELVKTLLPNATILMVTHDPEDAKRIADHVIFVDGGTVEAPVETDDFFANPHDALARYLT